VLYKKSPRLILQNQKRYAILNPLVFDAHFRNNFHDEGTEDEILGRIILKNNGALRQ
jgi:hypothetical protein